MSVFIMINSFVLTKKSYLYCHFLGNLHEHVFNFLTEKFQTCTSCESIQRKINFFFKISDCYLFLEEKIVEKGEDAGYHFLIFPFEKCSRY